MHCIFSEYPQLCVKVKVASQKSHDEQFSLVVRGNLAQIEAASATSANYAKAQLLAGLQANRLGDFVGDSVPQFCLRPLWVDCVDDVSLTQLFDLGYNILVVAFASMHHPLVQDVRKNGLKVAVVCSSLDQVKALIGACDYVLWQQGDLKLADAKGDLTPCEQAEYELKELEAACLLPILYYSKPSCPFLQRLLTVTSKQTYILFDALDKGVLSPVFTELSQLPYDAKTRLLPMLHVAQMALPNSSLFSDFSPAIIENVLGRQKQGRFIGAGCKVAALPQSGEFAEMPLWVAGQRMWRTLHSQSLFEVWLARYRPEWSSLLVPELLQLIHILFRCRDEANVEKAVKTLVELAEVLTQYKRDLRFQKPTKKLEELSRLLLELQQGFKGYFEGLCQQKTLKIPLALQNFIPISFLVAQKTALV